MEWINLNLFKLLNNCTYDKVLEVKLQIDMKNFLKIITFSLPLIALDQLTKYYAVQGDLNQEFIPGFFRFTLKYNEGIALSIPLEGNLQLIVIFGILLVGAYYVKKYFDLSKPIIQFTVASILGGAIGNLIDRFTRGAVVDFIAVWDFPVFNLADVFIFYSVCILIYMELRGKGEEN